MKTVRVIVEMVVEDDTDSTQIMNAVERGLDLLADVDDFDYCTEYGAILVEE